MTLANRQATRTYLNALNNMPDTFVGDLAALADQMAGEAFDVTRKGEIRPMSPDAMMSIETSMFVGLCEANGVDWRSLGVSE